MFLRIQSANIVIFIVILCKYLAATVFEMKKTVLALLTALVLSACVPEDRFIQVSGHAQGGVYTVKVNLKGVSVSPDGHQGFLRDGPAETVDDPPRGRHPVGA